MMRAVSGHPSMQRAAPKPDDMLCFAVYAAAHAFTRAYRPLLAPH